MSAAENGIDPKEHLGLVASIAFKYLDYNNHRRPIDQTDEFQNGCIGLVIASRKFDGSRDIGFATYATHWIRQCILRNKNLDHRSRRNRNSKFPISEYPLKTFSSLDDSESQSKRGLPILDQPDDIDHLGDLENRDFYEWIQEPLTDRERVIIYRHLERNETFVDIAKCLIGKTVSKSLVQFIYQGAIAKMRERAKGYGFTASNF